MQVERGGEAYTKVGSDTPGPSQGSQHRCVSTGGLQSKLYGDRPARWFGEGTTSTPSLTLRIPRRRGGQQGREGRGFRRSCQDSPSIPSQQGTAPRARTGVGTKTPVSHRQIRRTSMQQKRYFPKY